jgi:hypothetical protein
LGTEGIFPWHPGFLPFLERVSTEETVPLERYVEAFSPSEIRYQLTSVMYIHPGGRGAELLARHLPLYPSEALLGHPCDRALGSPDHAHIDYEGNYLTGFCSGLRIGERTGLDLERLFVDGIPLENYPLLDMLVNGGLKTLYGFALESGYSPRPQGYVSPCHLCLDMRVHLYSGGPDFPELYPGFFYDELPRAPFCP